MRNRDSLKRFNLNNISTSINSSKPREKRKDKLLRMTKLVALN